MKIDEMQAGREMDELIAEKVMGWKRGNTKYGEMPWYPTGKIPCGHRGRLGVPCYSIEIEKTWNLVEWMKDWNMELNWYGNDWEASFDTDEDGEYYAIAPTAPLAICRAALKAVTGKEEL